jgi:hypothetical protein
MLREHTVPDSARILGVECTFERDTRVGLPVTTDGNTGWTVRAYIDGHEYRIGLHYSAKYDGYSAAGKVAYRTTWEYAMERDGVPALVRQMESLARLNGR